MELRVEFVETVRGHEADKTVDVFLDPFGLSQ